MTKGAGSPFPHALLFDLEGLDRPIAEAWSRSRALIVIGHRDCKTTRQTLPFVDRIHARKGKDAHVVVVLQDDAATASSLAAEQSLNVPILLEPDPYRLAAALELAAVPTLFLVSREGLIEDMTEGFSRDDLERHAAALGVPFPLFHPTDTAPLFRPG